MAKHYAFPLLAFMMCCVYSSDSFAMDTENDETLKKSSANSNITYSNYNDACQGEIHALDEHYGIWIDNLEIFFENKSKIEISNEMDEPEIELYLGTAFQIAYDFNPTLYREPITIEGLTFYILHGMTPQKDTPRRKDNIKTMTRTQNRGPGVFVDPTTNEISRKELHHVQQNPTTGFVVMQPRHVHKENHGVFHPFTKSRIDKNKWASIKRQLWWILGLQMQRETKDQDNYIFSPSKLHSVPPRSPITIKRKSSLIEPSSQINKKIKLEESDLVAVKF